MVRGLTISDEELSEKKANSAKEGLKAIEKLETSSAGEVSAKAKKYSAKYKAIIDQGKDAIKSLSKTIVKAARQMVVDTTKVVVDHTMTSWRNKLSDVADFGIVRSTAESRLCGKDKPTRHKNSHRYAAIISDAAERLKEYKDACKMWKADEEQSVIE